MRRKIIVGNWKMNGSISANATLLAELNAELKSNACDIAICPPTVYLAQCHSLLTGGIVSLGAQDASEFVSGAYTGEISAAMLRDVGCSYVILGHSERRAYHHESSQLVAKKTLAAIDAGLTPIVCVGETLEQYEAGQTNPIVRSQIDALLAFIPQEKLARLIIAYEPIWAIGSGKTATPEIAQEVHAMIRAIIASKNQVVAPSIRILYGGSMKPENALDLLKMQDIDGGLIGGAALKASDFLAIIKAAYMVAKTDIDLLEV